MGEYAVFEDAEAEYKRYSDTLRARIADIGDGASASDVRTLESDARAARECIRVMDMETRGFSERAARSNYASKVSLYRSVLSDINKDIKRLKDKSARVALLGGGDVEMSESVSHREWLLQQTDKTRASTSALEAAARTIADTEQVAIGITGELARNRETILNASRKARETTSMTHRARRLVKGMQRRNLYTKMILCFFIVLMLAVICLVLYFVFFNSPGDEAATGGSTGTGSGSG